MTEEKTVLALGFFDGVHLGHAALLRACRSMADALRCRAGVVTFTGHPDALVSGAAPGLINTQADRERLLLGCGMDLVLPLAFDRAMMEMPWQAFLNMLVRDHGAAGLVCGYDFRFGKDGGGNSRLLADACRAAGLPCTVVPEQRLDGVTVSSTYIRTLLEAGEMERAVRFLGHPHVLTGQVVPGRGLGHTLGFPTANLAPPPGLLIPKLGVYACQALLDGRAYPAVTNVGTRPTVDGQGVTVEAWLPNYTGTLYGKTVTLCFCAFLRPERRFASVSDLQAEVRKNAAQTLDFFEKSGKFSFTFG